MGRQGSLSFNRADSGESAACMRSPLACNPVCKERSRNLETGRYMWKHSCPLQCLVRVNNLRRKPSLILAISTSLPFPDRSGPAGYAEASLCMSFAQRACLPRFTIPPASNSMDFPISPLGQGSRRSYPGLKCRNTVLKHTPLQGRLVVSSILDGGRSRELQVCIFS